VKGESRVVNTTDEKKNKRSRRRRSGNRQIKKYAFRSRDRSASEIIVIVSCVQNDANLLLLGCTIVKRSVI
ncbi:MAG: hypothetical protein ACI8RD_009381, partial [Bacillariaceae sp.]|jgi:hypothetical protein